MGFLLGEHDRQAELSDALADCLERLRDGESIDSILAAHPAHAGELKPLLRTAVTARTRFAVPIREERRLSARSEFLQAAARQPRAASLRTVPRPARTQRPPSVLTRPLWSAFAPAVAAAALFVVALVPILSLTSTNALPGDWNYGFKRSTELVRLALTLNPADRLNLEIAFHDRRLGELEQLAATGRLTNPSLVEQLTNETSALVQTVSDNPQLGPSEALKVVQQTQAQVQALNDKIAPLAPASIKPAIDDAVQQTQQVEAQADAVAQAKVDAAQTQSSNGASKYPRGSSNAKNAFSDSATATATATAQATATASAGDSATATETPQAGATSTATPGATSTAAPIVPPPNTAPSVRPSPPFIAGAPVIQPPSSPRPPSSAIGVAPNTIPGPTAGAAVVPAPLPPVALTPAPTPTPLVPPAQPPAGQSVGGQVLPAGKQSTFVYNGPAQAVSQALAGIAGQVNAVFFTQPQNGGYVYAWYPGQSSQNAQSNPNAVLEPGSLVTIEVKPGAPAVLTSPNFAPR